MIFAFLSRNQCRKMASDSQVSSCSHSHECLATSRGALKALAVKLLKQFWVLRIWDKNTIDECPAKIAKLEEDKIKKATLCKRCEDPFLILILSVRKLSYRYQDLIKLISLLLMPWLLVSPGHQQTWCWLFEIGKSLSYTRKDSNYLCHISVKEW